MSGTRSNLILWILFGLACLFLYPFNEKVVCETRHENRAVQLVSYTKLQLAIPIPLPWVTRHEWLEGRLGVRFVDGWQSRWLIQGARSGFVESLRHAACYSAAVTKDSFIYFPIKTASGQHATYEDAAFAVVPAMPAWFERRWEEGFISGGFPYFFYGTVRPSSQDMEWVLLEQLESSDSHSRFVWVTTSFEGVGSRRIIATQFGRAAKDNDYRDFAYEAYQLGGHPVSAPGTPSSDKVVSLKRRLRSHDGGRTWQLHDWEVLRPELLPKGRTISPACPC